MSQQGSAGNGPDFDLPDHIRAVIPADPYDQLDLARKITSMAIASRVSNLESDLSRLHLLLRDKDDLIRQLEDKVSRLENTHSDSDGRLKLVLQDNMKLTKERDSMSLTIKKLSRDLAKLETFKRQLMQSLNDDNSSAETVDIGTYNQAKIKSYHDDGENKNGYGSTTNIGNATNEASGHAIQKFSITPYITPKLTPTGTPKAISIAGSPKGYSAAVSPNKTSGATSPTKAQYAMSPWYSSSQQTSAANSPPRGRSYPSRTPRIDGKEFFRQARTRLSYEQFSAFLANIKELNAQKQTREETLRKAEEIFGLDNKDLYLSFQGLLNRNMQ
ncbi:hypothetical protein MLD38_021938 [Melastoma candidum]|uniref:Uncharacterized protein n=1 Tax=Melastoma candidum TaxID=119954 RepID=A0ACB9QIU7_9MYRT|nr:hypothetical protein MLD38_021938 [Melastoma candidum]